MPVPVVQEPVAGDGLLSDAVFERLAIAIIDGTLEQGEQLRERELIQWLGVSRTPVREALQRLEQLGLVETSASRYTRVTYVTDDLIRDTLEWTGHQAGLAVRLAIPRMTDEEIATAAEMVGAMITANNIEAAEELYTTSRRFVDYAASRTGNAVFIRIMRETDLAMERNLRNARPMIGSRDERTDWYEQLRKAIEERDADYAEFAFRKQHHL